MKKANDKKSGLELNTEFIQAAGKGNLKAAREWIASGNPVIWKGNGNTTALIHAAENGHADVVKELISAGARLNETTTGNWSALALATTRGHQEVVKVLLDAGADPNIETKLGDTPLALALRGKRTKIVGLLKSRRARLATSRALHDVAYQCAREYALSRTTKASLGRPPNPGQRKSAANKAARLMKELAGMIGEGAQGGDYALSAAASCGFRELVALLIGAKANVNSAPHISSALANASENGHLEIVRDLLDAGASVDFGGSGRTPLQEAVKKGHVKVVEELVRRGANVNVRSRLGPTPLLVATTSNDLPMMRALLAGGADPNLAGTVEVGPKPKPTVEIERTKGSRIISRTTHYPDAPEAMDVPPVVVAVRRNYLDALKLLIDSGADVEAKDKEGRTALAWARNLKLKKATELLAAAGANTNASNEGTPDNALLVAAAAGDLAKVEQLLATGANADSHQDNVKMRQTPLGQAARNGHAAIVSALLRAGANVDKPEGERIGTRNLTPLMLAAEAGHAEVVELLIKSGADIHAKDVEVFGGGGNTPLHYAALSGSDQVVKLLLEAGADHLARNANRMTPLQQASANGHRKVMAMLLAAGNRVVTRKGSASSVIGAAAFSGNLEAVKALLAANPKACGNDLNLATSVCFGATPEIVRVLVEAGMPVNGRDRDGDTPLNNAIRAGRTKLVEYLLSVGADPQAKTNDGKTPYMEAKEFGYDQIAKLIRRQPHKPIRPRAKQKK